MFSVVELKENGLLENGEKEWEHMEFEGLSRREIVRKVGFASLVALPIVYSVVAPAAAQNGSCFRLGDVKARCEGVVGTDYSDCARACFRGGSARAVIADLNPALGCCSGSRLGIAPEADASCITTSAGIRCNCTCVPA